MNPRPTQNAYHLLLATVLLIAIAILSGPSAVRSQVSASELHVASSKPLTGSVIYLPLIFTPPGPPQVQIVAPGANWQISGMHFFAVQPVSSDPVSKVFFKAGNQPLGTDSTPADGFNLLFDASNFPDGVLQLTAIAEGPGGQTAAQVNVTVVAHPPSAGLIGSEGGVLATKTGSVITFPPGAVSSSTTITVTERSQAQVTAENGIDWDSLGITFLGDQKVESSGAVTGPLGVSSAGFGNRVQPGQMVVNYTLLPDVNGDGVDELVVINNATVAPNDAVVSNPVPQVLVKSVQSVSVQERQPTAISQKASSQTVKGRPGDSVRIRLSGLNYAALLGNIGTWKSLVDGSTVSLGGRVLPDPLDLTQQIFSTKIPPLIVGMAELRIQNLSVGSTSVPITVEILTSPPLAEPAQAIIKKFMADTLELLESVPVSGPEEVEALGNAINLMKLAQVQFTKIVADELTPEREHILANVALMIQNANLFPAGATSIPLDIRAPKERDFSLGTLIGVVGVIGQYVADAASASSGGWAEAAAWGGTVSGVATYIGGALILCNWVVEVNCIDELSEDIWDYWQSLELPDLCPPGYQAITSGGAGAVPFTGGLGCGLVIPGVFTGITERSDNSARSVVVKVFLGTQFIPISGVVDDGGYFYLPLIPKGEPFTALAIDTTTGATRTRRGVGPEENALVYLFFDFGVEQANTTLESGRSVTGTIGAPGQTIVYPLYGVAGERHLFRLMTTSGSLVSRLQVFRPDGSTLCQRSAFIFALVHEVCNFDVDGYYVVVVNDNSDTNTGDYALSLQRTDMPANAQASAYGSVGSGSTALGVELAAYTFEGVVGDQLLTRVGRRDGALNPGLYVYRPDGSLLCQRYGTTQLVESRCVLDSSGTHTVFVGDALGQGFGRHDIFLQRLNVPVGATAIAYSQTRTGAISPTLEMDAYTFNGTSGDKIVVRMTQNGGTLKPDVRVYRPDHTILCQSTAVIGNVAETQCTLDSSGSHTILTSDWQGENAGTYDIFIDTAS